MTVLFLAPDFDRILAFSTLKKMFFTCSLKHYSGFSLAGAAKTASFGEHLWEVDSLH